MKVVAGTTLERSELDRLEELAAVDHRSLASTIRLAVLRGLPLLETEILGPQFAGKPVSPAPPAALAKEVAS